jgi:hypothetical protein
MAELVEDDVGTLRGMDRDLTHGLLVKLQPARTTVESVEIRTGNQPDPERIRRRGPGCADRQQRRPEIDAAGQRLFYAPVAKFRRSGVVAAGRGPALDYRGLQLCIGIHWLVDGDQWGHRGILGGRRFAEGIVIPGVDLRCRYGRCPGTGRAQAWGLQHHRIEHLHGLREDFRCGGERALCRGRGFLAISRCRSLDDRRLSCRHRPLLPDLNAGTPYLGAASSPGNRRDLAYFRVHL